MKKTTQGFTLIELLVVIAIIGILSSIVIASLNSARTKGAVSAAKGGASQVRTQAEVYFDTAAGVGGTGGGAGAGYATTSACAITVTTAGVPTVSPNGIGSGGCLFADTTLQSQLKQIAANSNTSVLGTVDSSFQKWAVSSMLKDGSFMCVDNSGNTKQQTTNTNATTTPGVCN